MGRVGVGTYINARSSSHLVYKGLRKLEKSIHISKIRHQTNRNAQRPLLAAIDNLEKLVIGHALLILKALGQVLFGKAEGDLAHTRIAKAPTAHGERTAGGLLLNRIEVKQDNIRVVEIEGDCPATSLGSDRTIDAHHWLAVAMAQRQQILQ